jgi:guanosine-3',5'-bis(diphosphate) 3'-pyrophosphohydrolase
MATNKELNRAIVLATTAHKDQVDRGGQPYILHPLRVMLSVKSLDEKIVAVLHDVIEDTEITSKDLLVDFPTYIVEAVESVSRKDNETYIQFIKRADLNSIGRVVKIANIKDNLNLNRPGSLEFLSGGICKRYYEALYYLEGDHK